MKRSSIRASMACAALVAGFAGLAGSPSLGAVSSTAPSLSQPAIPAAKVDTVVVTGCVAVGATAGQYMLRNAAVEGVASTSPNIMHSAPAADMNKDGRQVAYALKGGELKAHVGHKVAVTGTMDDAKAGDLGNSPVGSAGTSPTASAPGTASTQGAGAMAGDARTLNVTSVKMVASSCS